MATSNIRNLASIIVRINFENYLRAFAAPDAIRAIQNIGTVFQNAGNITEELENAIKQETRQLVDSVTTLLNKDSATGENPPRSPSQNEDQPSDQLIADLLRYCSPTETNSAVYKRKREHIHLDVTESLKNPLEEKKTVVQILSIHTLRWTGFTFSCLWTSGNWISTSSLDILNTNYKKKRVGEDFTESAGNLLLVSKGRRKFRLRWNDSLETFTAWFHVTDTRLPDGLVISRSLTANLILLQARLQPQESFPL